MTIHNDPPIEELRHDVLNLIVKGKGLAKAAETSLMSAIFNLGRAMKNYKDAQAKLSELFETCGEIEGTLKNATETEDDD